MTYDALDYSIQPNFRSAGLIYYPSILFQWLIRIGRFTVVLKENFTSDVKLRHDSVVGQRVLWSELPIVRALILDHPDRNAMSMLSQSDSGSIGLAVAATDIDTAKSIICDVKKVFPPAAITEDQIVPILFWHSGDMGSTAALRKMPVVAWDQVSCNYTEPTSADLGSLMQGFEPAKHHGRLMLWHGEPGTGKTYAIRALAWAWRKWCRFEYVTDPERLFGDAGYLMEVLLNSEYTEKNDRWRLLIVEDSGELLTMDAKSVVGQGLSRLLGLADGLLGQGSRILTLITTNEDLGRFNPALLRPGRCLSEIQSSRFGAEEANLWLEAAKTEKRTSSAKTLSELYAMLNGKVLNRSGVQIGFRS